MLFYKEFTEILATNYNHRVEFLLPDKTCIPPHYHITDVGSIHRYFIDCGGQRRNENYLQIQLWLGNDKGASSNNTNDIKNTTTERGSS